MKLQLLFAIISLVGPLSGATATPRLEGCADAPEIAKALAKLEEKDWQEVSLAQLRPIWPTELVGLSCDSDVCHSVWSKDRIIGGHCQCCATFSFKVQAGENGPRNAQLDEVIINYAALQREEIVAIAKAFAKASGLGAADLATVGRDSVQNFHWSSLRGKHQELSGIEVRISREGRVWELYLNWGRNPI